MNTGEKIRMARKKRKLTQSEIADNLNISQRAYSKIENNEVSVKLDRLESISHLLNVELKDLLPESPIQHFENVSQSQIGNGHYINQTSDKEIFLWEKIIDRQQKEIDYLKGLIDVFKK